jgi:hypothetical protein
LPNIALIGVILPPATLLDEMLKFNTGGVNNISEEDRASTSIQQYIRK